MDNIDYDKIINDQPTTNIGMLGSVSNGKSSLVERVTTTKTQRHSSEKKTNKTIKLGYANAKIFKCEVCEAPACYQSFPSCVYNPKCEICELPLNLIRHVSFVDCPGHNQLMATMLNGTCVMDSSIIVESANNDELPAPQTIEHLIAAKIMEVSNKIVCMNKLDLVKKDIAIKKINDFKKYLVDNDTVAKDSEIIPIVGNYNYNKDVLCEYICKLIPEPKRDFTSGTKMIIIRSFNVNACDKQIKDIVGGVVGGTIIKGVIRIGDKVEILPGLVQRKKNEGEKKINDEENEESKWTYTPLTSYVKSINSETNNLQMAVPGGLIGVQLNLDPGFTEKDGLIGSVLRVISNVENKNESKYNIYETLNVFLKCINDKEVINKGDELVVNYNAKNVKCIVLRIKKDKAQLELEKPICVENNDHITLSKNVGTGSGIILIGRAKVDSGINSQKNAIENFFN